MKKILPIIFIIGLIGGVYYSFFTNKGNQLKLESEPSAITDAFETTKIANLSFSYLTSPDGYVLIKNDQKWPENKVSSISLFNKRYYEWFSEPGFLGEGPPAIIISVFNNPSHLTASAWAEANSLESNIKLISSPPTKATIKEGEGIFYVVDGLYLFDTYVIVRDDKIYLLSGAYLEKDDKYYDSFTKLVSTIFFE